MKALFINEQGYELDCLPVHIRTSSSKASNDLSCLNSNQSVLMIEQAHWLCSANHQFFLSYFQFTGHWAAPSRSCCQPFWPDGARRLSPLGGTVSQGPCLGRRERGWPQATFSFPNSFSGWKQLGTTLSLGYEFVPWPVCSTGSPHVQKRLCSEGNQVCLPTSGLKHG